MQLCNEPKEYTDTILATGFSNKGKTLKGLVFLDGDDDKNSIMSFDKLSDFSEWYRGNRDLILVKPAIDRMTTKEACKIALLQGYELLSNTVDIKNPYEQLNESKQLDYV